MPILIVLWNTAKLTWFDSRWIIRFNNYCRKKLGLECAESICAKAAILHIVKRMGLWEKCPFKLAASLTSVIVASLAQDG
jgi:hypothetical protein